MTNRELISKIETERKRINIDIETIPHTTRSSVMAMIQQAKARCEQYSEELFQNVIENSVALFLSGSPEKTNKFIQIAVEEAGMQVIDVGVLYSELSERPMASISPHTHEFMAQQLELLIDSMVAKSLELDMESFVAPELRSTFIVSNDEMPIRVRKLVESVAGQDWTIAYIQKKLRELVLGPDLYAEKVLPVLILNADRDALVDIFPASIAVNADEMDVIDKASVLKELKELRKSIKSKNNKNNQEQ